MCYDIFSVENNCLRSFLSLFGGQLVGEGDVFGSGLFLGVSLGFSPGFVLGFAFEVEHAGGRGVDVSDGGLFVPFIEFEEFIIRWFRFEIFDNFCSLSELCLGHVLM